MSESNNCESDLSALLCGGFRPIDTAPKDGTEVLVRFVLNECGSIEIKNAWFDGGWKRICHTGSTYQYFSFGEITHWMPIPEINN